MKCDELTPIELECNMGKDINGVVHREPWKAYDIDEVNLLLEEQEAEIAALKKKLMPCLNGDCILTCDTVEKYGKENASLKAKLDDTRDAFIFESQVAVMRERRLLRELWIARANRAIEKISWFKLWNASISTMNPEDGARQEFDKWKMNLGKFLKKAEEYK